MSDGYDIELAPPFFDTDTEDDYFAFDIAFAFEGFDIFIDFAIDTDTG
jgi:hypothetical protein